MIHPNAELAWINEEIGLGVAAKTLIPKGTIVWVLDTLDRILSAKEVKALPEPLQQKMAHFEYVTKAGDHILCWDIARYMNHSCNPATRSLGQSFELARRDIFPGEQLTCDYGALYLQSPLQCRCGETTCRAVIQASDHEKYQTEWEQEAALILKHALRVEQPLLSYCKTIDPDDAQILARFKAAGTQTARAFT
jgi:hypothetical protein